MAKVKTGIAPESAALGLVDMETIAGLLEMKEPKHLSDGTIIGETLIGPAEADLLLDINTSNRNLSSEHIGEFARMMSKGKWLFNGAPIGVGIDNSLQDGQHRLKAVQASGTTQRFLVILGLPPEAQDVTDTGRKRSASDTLTLHGVTNSANTAATVRLLMAWDAGQVLHASYSVGNIEVREFVDVHSELIGEAVHVGLMARQNSLPISTAVVAALYFKVRSDEAIGRDRIDTFFDRVCQGVNLASGDPEYALRRLFLRRRDVGVRTPRGEALFYLIRAWNARMKGERLTKLQLPRFGLRAETFPRPISSAQQPEVGVTQLAAATSAPETEAASVSA